MNTFPTDAEEVAAHAVARRFLGPDQPRTADLITSRILDALATHVAAREARAAARERERIETMLKEAVRSALEAGEDRG